MKIVGRVEAMNGAGGYGIMRHECVGTKNNNSWVSPMVELHDLGD